METIDKNKIINNALQVFKQYRTPKMQSLCSRFFPKKENKNLIASTAIMKLIFDKYFEVYNKPIVFYKKKLVAHKFKDTSKITYRADTSSKHKNNNSDCMVDTLLIDALKILRCNKLILLNRQEYILNLKYFYYQVRYRIKDNEVLKDMTPLMLSYLKNNIELSPHNFFQELDKLLKYILQPPKSHNKKIDLEYSIYKSIANNDTIHIIVNGTTIEINPLSIDINGVYKELVYENLESSKIEKNQLSNISLSTATINIKESAKEKVTLAVNKTLFDYFHNLDIFEYMDFKDTKHINIKLHDKDSPTEYADIFILEVEDTVDKIVSIVQQNFQDIKVLSHSVVKETIKANLEQYRKNDSIDIATII
ncbi:MAG: hypothetical protein GQ474_03060 [Sulfurimonas sp.]|nr:hypothetical protein [Sulfurimonas sp.]